jgi:hypothetical protein
MPSNPNADSDEPRKQTKGKRKKSGDPELQGSSTVSPAH